MAANVRTVEFGTTHKYSSPEENCEASWADTKINLTIM